jgi:hypothetical protein
MSSIFENEFIAFAVSLVVQLLSAYVGDFLTKREPLKVDVREDFDIVRNAALTLLVLVQFRYGRQSL